MRANRVVIFGVVCALLGAGIAYAGDEANAPTVTGETGLFTLLTGRTLGRGYGSFGLYYNNWDRVIEDAGESDLDWNRLSASVGYGFTDNFEMSIMVPYEDLDFDFDPGILDGFDDGHSGLGNARLGAKWMVSGDDDGAFAINAFVELPTGDGEVLAGDTGFGLGANWSRRNWVFNVGYRAPGEIDGDEFFGVDGLDASADLDPSDEVLAGIGYAGRVSDSLDWITEAVGTLPLDSDDAIFEESVDLTTGGRYWFGEDSDWAFNFALRTDLLQLADTDEHCPLGGLLGLTYFPALFRERPPEIIPAVPIDYGLTVSKEGDCTGTVTSNPAGIDCGADCSEDYVEGTVVALTATPDADCTFGGWSGDADCADAQVTMNGDRHCVATFNPVAAPPPPPPPERREVERICHFGPGSARVDNACKAILDEVALLMRDRSEATALVIGYSDTSGSEAANMQISQQRAENVKNWLVTRHGIDPSRITVEARGEAEASGDAAEDRRAVIRVTIVG